MIHLFDILHQVLPGIAIAAWATVFVRLQESGEAFSFVPNLVARVITFGKAGAKGIGKVRGLRFAIWKWTTCAKCHAGIVSVAVALVSLQDLSQITPYLLRDIWLSFTSAVFFAIFFERI